MQTLKAGAKSAAGPPAAEAIQPVFDSLIFPRQALVYERGRFEPKTGLAIGVRGGRIAFLGPASPELQAKAVYKLDRHLLCPGLINTHTHLPMSLFRGLADDLPLMSWLENYIFPLERGFLTEESAVFGARLSAVELVRSGTTCFFDMYFYSQALAEAMHESGLRGFVGLGVPSVEKDSADWRQKTLSLRDLCKGYGKIRAAIAPHAPYSVPPKTLAEIADFSKEEAIPLSIHVSESAWEQAEIKKKHGASPVRHLHSLGATGPGSLFAHCVYADEADLEIMAETKTSLSHNPESNMKIRNGIAPVAEALSKGVAVGLGTDGAASNNNLNLFGEMDTAAKLQALKYGEKSPGAMDIFKMATIGGAKAIGLESEIGLIEEGMQADFMAVRLDTPAFSPPHNFISALVYAASGSETDFVMCGGEVLMERGELKTLDEEKILRESRLWGEKIQLFLKKSP